jgi:hypothetical protein
MNKKIETSVIIVIGIIILVAGSYFAYPRFIKNFRKSTKPTKTTRVPNTITTESARIVNKPKKKAVKKKKYFGKKDCKQYNWSKMNEGPYKDKISFATSKNLLEWTDQRRVLATHASVPGAVYKKGVIYVYYVNVAKDCYPEQLGLIKSANKGKTWTKEKILIVKGLGSKVIADPAPFLLPDGRIRLYYFDISQRPNPNNSNQKSNVYSVISKDGMNFVQEKGVRFSSNAVFDPDVVKVGKVWRIYVGDIQGNRVIYGISSNGMNFIEKGVAFNGGAVPDVFYKNGEFYLFTAGIQIARSKNGKLFQNSERFFNSRMGNITADPSVIEIGKGDYMMIYKFKTGK